MRFDFDAAVQAPFRMQPGLRRLAAGAPQLTPAAPGARHQREKMAVLSCHAPQALLVQAGFDATSALRALFAEAARLHPSVWQWNGHEARAQGLGTSVDASGAVHQHAAGIFGLGDEVSRCLQGLPPAWRQVGLLCLAFEDDFALLDGSNASIPWLAVALPSFWAPETKVGRHFAEVHAPVADSELLQSASQALSKLVCGPERWERFVWTVSDHPRLHAHPARTNPQRWQDTPVASAWWRTEHQTFIPLPGLNQAVFTIRVQVQPLAAAVQPAGRAKALHDAIASMSNTVLDYRGLTPIRDALLQWLHEQASPQAARSARPG